MRDHSSPSFFLCGFLFGGFGDATFRRSRSANRCRFTSRGTLNRSRGSLCAPPGRQSRPRRSPVRSASRFAGRSRQCGLSRSLYAGRSPARGPVGRSPVDGAVGRCPILGPVGRFPIRGPVGRSCARGPVGRSPVRGPVGRSPVRGPVGRSPARGPGGRSPNRGAPGRARRRSSASRASSGDVHRRPRANHIMMASGCFDWSWRSVGRSSSRVAERNAVG